MKKENRIYVSLPMGGVEDTIEKRYYEIITWANEHLKNYELVWPNNIEQFLGANPNIERDHSYEWYIGEDIKILMTCGSILMTENWRESRGCKIEKAVAETLGMGIVFI